MPNLPFLNGASTTREVIDTFAGYNHNLKIRDGEFFFTKDMTTRYYPMLANRQRRGIMDHQFTKLQAIIAKDALYWVENGTLYANGSATGLTGLQTANPTQLVSMGAYICVFPDKMYINTKNLTEFGSMDASWTLTGNVTYTMCQQDGTPYSSVTRSGTAPEAPSNGDIWIDENENVAKEYSEYTASWITLETVFTKCTFTSQGAIPAAFKEYDGVEISGLHFEDLNGSKIIYALGGAENTEDDWIVLVGILGEAPADPSATVTIKREVPDMDYVCEAQNRLWGCRYGYDSDLGKTLNELYCCALGDFKNWSQYLGVSTDSWRASRGSDGPWTGCINYLGSPTFFKENVIHPISVSSIGAHQVGDIPARGVQQGSYKSLAVVNETLYYKSRTGVMAYQGGIPAEVGEALGDEKYYRAVAGAFGQRYYICMSEQAEDPAAPAESVWHLFCYDAGKGIWMREDNLHAECFAQVDDELYVQSENKIYALNGTTEGKTGWSMENAPKWIVETGIQHYEYPDKKYVSRYNIRLQMEKGSRIQMYMEYDSKGPWIFMGDVKAGDIMTDNTGTANIPVRPRRCDHLRFKLEGTGNVRILSIARLLQKGSDM